MWTVILSKTTPGFGQNEDMYGFWSIWWFFVIWCSWNGRSTKLVERVSNGHLSSIFCMKCRHVGGKYMYFMATNTPHTHTHTHLEFCSSLSKRKRIKSWGHKQELQCCNCSRIKNTTHTWALWMCLCLEPYDVERLEQLCHFSLRSVLVITWFTLPSPFLKLYHSITHPPSHSFPLG
jgi:hypothetical protein